MVEGKEEIIETDLDTTVEDGKSEGGSYPYDPSFAVTDMTLITQKSYLFGMDVKQMR